MLATKLYVPPPRPDAVVRPHLLARLSAGLRGKLTLIAAPAGFGKTTLVSAWTATCGRSVAWLALDAGDGDPVRFLTYLIAALQKSTPDVGQRLLAALAAPQPPAAEAVLTALLNDLARLETPLLLVLDDYHAIDSPAVDAALTFFIAHLPPDVHLAIATREEPRLPLARWRARNQLTELRARDLRFTEDETAAFLWSVMGLQLAPAERAALAARTEGWVAGLQLAALSLRERGEIGSFVAAFHGDNRHIVDYLVEEVLHQQPEPVRSFLLQTAILDRLHGPLCEAVTGQERGQAQLEALERGNFFVVPLDDTRQQYRYHHLFGEALRAQLRREQPDLVATLHRRASAWYAQHAAPAEAIRHALAAEDFARAADLVELTVPAMRQSRQDATLLGWLRALPAEVLSVRPVLSVAAVGALLAVGELNGVEEHLRVAERWLDPTTVEPAQPADPAAQTAARQRHTMIVTDAAAFPRLPGAIAVYRAGLALARGDLADTEHYARLALDRVPPDDHLLRGAAAGLLGLAQWTSGDLGAARRSYTVGMTHLQTAGHLTDVAGCAVALGDVLIVQGRLREAMQTYAQGLQLVTAAGAPPLRGAADMYVGMSELAREHNDLAAAAQHVRRCQELGEHLGLPQNAYRWRVALAQIKAAHGDLDGALGLLDEAEHRYAGDFFPNVRPIAALRARVWIAQGRLDEALAWARLRGLSVQDALSYLREFEHITLVRALLARATGERAADRLADVLVFLQRLLRAAETGERTGSVIEICILQALAHQACGDMSAALLPLGRALTLAEPEGYVRTFLDHGKPMALLLTAAANHALAPDYVRQLRAALDTAAPAAPAGPALIEPLSARELAVLRLLGTDLSGPEIARALVVSLNTLRTHTSHIYGKLGVNNRRAAVRRAEELDLYS